MLRPQEINTITSNIKNSPLFDGSATSMSGNGAFVDYPGIPVVGAPAGLNDLIPSAGGGGCVTTGPFKKYALPGPEPTSY